MTNDAAQPRPALAVTFRTATAADAQALSEFGARVFHDTFAADNDPSDMQAYLRSAFSSEKQAAELANSSCLCLIAEVGEVMAAYALLRIEAADEPARPGISVELQRFYVDQVWHGHGIAPRLMAACVDAACARGGTSLWLGVWERNARAIRFYEKHGFTDVGSQTFQLGRDLQLDRVMSRSIMR